MARLIWLLLGLVAVLQVAQADPLTNQTTQVAQVGTLANQTKESPPHCAAVNRTINLETLANGKKYFFSRWYVLTFDLAIAGCKEFGLHLAHPKNQADLDALHKRADYYDEHWWFYGARNFAEPGEAFDYRWEDGTKLEENSPLWGEGADLSRGCVDLWIRVDSKLRTSDCTRPQFFVCEVPAECY
ncbi:uncharacterized protein LOC132195697 [Neocloeon triangulifer]|uniref:uncharacterized protein LOC132195697 n=1 Tax=Neocloeon triangulifer TaxID=2078957 RepID=UPI00286F69CE|nr:uncharacterized protein LOC132195697 [Neocloeon triangulifer]